MSNKNGLVVIPTFHLRGINPTEILQAYYRGEFVNIEIPKEQIVIRDIVPLVAPQYGVSMENSMYAIKNKVRQEEIIFATINHKAYEMYTKSGNKLPTEGRCLWCRYDHKGPEMPGPIVGYKQEIFNTKSGTTYVDKRIHCFWTDGQCCDLECVLSFSELYANLPPDKRESQYFDSIYLVRFLHRLIYPNEPPLKPAPDFRLLDVNGGPLTYEQFKSKRHVYRRIPGMLLLPAKASYEQFSA